MSFSVFDAVAGVFRDWPGTGNRRPTFTTLAFPVGVLLLSAFGSFEVDGSRGSQELTVFAAASLTDALTEVGNAFEAERENISIINNFAASSQLAAQLREGVGADVFASANPTQMDNAIKAGRVHSGEQRTFVSNRLTAIVPKDNPAGVRSIEDLAAEPVDLILAVEGVPARVYTDEIVAAFSRDFRERFYANVVSEEGNVRRVAAKVALGEADAGIVYTSDVTPDIRDRVRQVPVPEERNIIASYRVAPVSDAPNPGLARDYVEFLLSPTGQEILVRQGFGPPPSD